MDARSDNVTQDGENGNDIDFDTDFHLPPLDQDELKQDRKQALNHHSEQTFLCVISALTSFDIQVSKLKDEQLAHSKRNEIADKLVTLAKTKDVDLGLNILIHAADHMLFIDTPAMPLINSGIRELVSGKLNQTAEDKEDDEVKNGIATYLVSLTQKVDHSLALDILINATQHALFFNSPALKIILDGIQGENYRRSPLTNGEKTVSFIKKYQIENPGDVKEFLHNPFRLLLWLNDANPNEIPKFANTFFPSNSETYNDLYNTFQNKNLDASMRSMAFLCFTVICPGRISHDGEHSGAEALRTALDFVLAEFPSKFSNIIRTLQASLFANIDTMRNANGCYVNLNKLELEIADLTNLNLPAAQLAQSQLAYATLSFSSFEHANFVRTTLTGAICEATLFAYANFHHANLSFANLYRADLRHADLTGADLSHANLCCAQLQGAILKETIIDGANFFRSEFFIKPSTFKQYLDFLHNCYSNHEYFGKIQQAVVKDLIEHTRTPHNVPGHAVEKILEIAYEHPLFSEHHSYHALKTLGNTVADASTTLVNYTMGLFKRTADIKLENNPVYETPAQLLLRKELDKHLSLGQSTVSNRPPPPSHQPSAGHDDEQKKFATHKI